MAFRSFDYMNIIQYGLQSCHFIDQLQTMTPLAKQLYMASASDLIDPTVLILANAHLDSPINLQIEKIGFPNPLPQWDSSRPAFIDQKDAFEIIDASPETWRALYEIIFTRVPLISNPNFKLDAHPVGVCDDIRAHVFINYHLNAASHSEPYS